MYYMFKRGDLLDKVQNKDATDWSLVQSKKVLAKTLKAERKEEQKYEL